MSRDQGHVIRSRLYMNLKSFGIEIKYFHKCGFRLSTDVVIDFGKYYNFWHVENETPSPILSSLKLSFSYNKLI